VCVLCAPLRLHARGLSLAFQLSRGAMVGGILPPDPRGHWEKPPSIVRTIHAGVRWLRSWLFPSPRCGCRAACGGCGFWPWFAWSALLSSWCAWLRFSATTLRLCWVSSSACFWRVTWDGCWLRLARVGRPGRPTYLNNFSRRPIAFARSWGFSRTPRNRSPVFANRSLTFRMVNCFGCSPGRTSFQSRGVATGAPS
jgi:hypothetical protein